MSKATFSSSSRLVIALANAFWSTSGRTEISGSVMVRQIEVLDLVSGLTAKKSAHAEHIFFKAVKKQVAGGPIA